MPGSSLCLDDMTSRLSECPVAIDSRLPEVGTTIFTVVSRRAEELGAVNLSQGFPDFSADPALFERVAAHMRAGRNQYAAMAGERRLREAIAAKMRAVYGLDYDPEQAITVSAGATQALFTAITALVHAGDEVIVFEPAFDAYVPALRLCGARPVFLRLHAPDFRPDWDALARALSPRTRMIILNSPHNPTGSVWNAQDMARLAAVLEGTRVLLLSDEVYEHIVFDGQRHESVARYPELARRAVLVSSFGKTFHVTGWKVGFVCAPPALSAEFRRVHQFNVFSVSTPMQHALADWLGEPAHYLELAAFYQGRRDLFRRLLAASGFEVLPCAGTYFQLARHPGLAGLTDAEAVEHLMREAGVAAIPVSAFHHDGFDAGLLRFCFAKREETLHAAAVRLQGWCPA